MKYPCLIPKSVCRTEVHIELSQEGVDKYGEPLEVISVDTKCNYQDKSKTIFTPEKKEVKLTGCIYIPGDIAPTLPTLSGGTVTIFEVKRRIYQGTKARNPDGTVNYTMLEVE